MPLGFVFTKVMDLGLAGIWYALILGYAVATILSVVAMLRSDWQAIEAAAVARSKHETEEETAEAKEAASASDAAVVDTAPLVVGYGATATLPSDASSALLVREPSGDDVVLGAPPRI